MEHALFSRRLRTEDESRSFAQKIADLLGIGDVVLLEGDIGAGKTFFARAAIQYLLGHPEDVPSPTFTIVQTYTTKIGEIWHCDLYRLTSPDEAIELGLDEAFEEAICLIEWPDRLGDLSPETALRLHFTAGETEHEVAAFGSNTWLNRLESVIE